MNADFERVTATLYRCLIAITRLSCTVSDLIKLYRCRKWRHSVISSRGRCKWFIKKGSGRANPTLTQIRPIGGEFYPSRPVFSILFCNRLELRGMLWWLFLNMAGLQNGIIRISPSPSSFPIRRPQIESCNILNNSTYNAEYLSFYAS